MKIPNGDHYMVITRRAELDKLIAEFFAKHVSADAYAGVWRGPEGTFLELVKTDAGYRVTIRNLDGPRTFDASAEIDGVSFMRDGIQETRRPGTGADTGMKWLVGKTDCLIVRSGEGYCRG